MAGRAFAGTASAADLLATEAATGRADRFRPIEKLAATVMRASLSGRPPVVLADDQDRPVYIDDLDGDDRSALTEHFDLARQQARGAWWLPESSMVDANWINLPAFYLVNPRWAINAATSAARRMNFAGSPDALACWALLAPFAEALVAPLALRGPKSGALAPADRDAAWAAVDVAYTALGFTSSPVEAALMTMRPGSGWSRLRVNEQVAARQNLVVALSSAVDSMTVARWRATLIRPLLDRYYTKAKKAQPEAKAVLTKPLQRTVAAFFAGDWLAFLDYIGEQPASGERIVAVLPEPRLYIEASAKVEQVAVQKRLPVDEVIKMLASYLGTDEVRSPIERRITFMKSFWQTFDELHAEQVPGARPLNSLVSGDRWLEQGEHVPFVAPISEEVVPAPMLSEIYALWGCECVPRFPERIVSTLYPHTRMAEAFGPSLRFWHEIAMTIWYLCEGPYARTDLAGLAEHYAADVDALTRLGAPVPSGLFKDLKAAEGSLGPTQQIQTGHDRIESKNGGVIEIAAFRGSRRDGFELVRDIVTNYRRQWASRYLEQVLRSGWEEPIRASAREFNRLIAAKGKPPTVKQFARYALSTLNTWFGGDLTALYVALGETPPRPQTRHHLLPYDRAALGNRVFHALDGRYVPNRLAGQDPTYATSWSTLSIAREAPRFVQLEELLGRPPTAAEFRAQHLRWPDGLDFERFAPVVEEVRLNLPTVRPRAED